MLPADDRERVTNIGDLLIELYTLRAAASGPEDWHRVRRLEEEVHRTMWEEASVIRQAHA
jgi:hypothetical protein